MYAISQDPGPQLGTRPAFSTLAPVSFPAVRWYQVHTQPASNSFLVAKVGTPLPTLPANKERLITLLSNPFSLRNGRDRLLDDTRA